MKVRVGDIWYDAADLQKIIAKQLSELRVYWLGDADTKRAWTDEGRCNDTGDGNGWKVTLLAEVLESVVGFPKARDGYPKTWRERIMMMDSEDDEDHTSAHIRVNKQVTAFTSLGFGVETKDEDNG